MKKKILFICFIDLGISGSLGIRKKVLGQIGALGANGLDVEYIYVDGGRLISNMLHLDSEPKIDYTNDLTNKICGVLMKVNFTDYHGVYVRFSVMKKQLINLLAHIKVQGKCKIALELPTYPFVGEYFEYIKRYLGRKDLRRVMMYAKRVMDYYILRSGIRKYVDRIVTFSDDKKIWDTQTIRISNGIDAAHITLPDYQPHQGIGLICVSSCLNWHGYDRAIAGLGEYCKKHPDTQIHLHIVGDGPEISTYHRLIQQFGIEDYVTCYGNLTGEKLDEVYAQSDIALDAMGRHRVGVYYNSSLKGKEYLCKGLPIVSGVITELDRENVPFYLRIPADDTPMDMGAVLEFYDSLEKTDLHHNLRKYAAKHFDFDVVMKPVSDFYIS